MSTSSISVGDFGQRAGGGRHRRVLRRDVADDRHQFFERSRHRAREAVRDEHRAAECDGDQRQRQRVIASGLQT